MTRSAFVLCAALLGAAVTAPPAGAFTYSQVFETPAGDGCVIWEPEQPRQRFRAGWGYLLQVLVGIVPHRHWWGQLCYGVAETFEAGAKITGFIADKHVLKRCNVKGRWWNTVDGQECMELSATCEGVDTLGTTTCYAL